MVAAVPRQGGPGGIGPGRARHAVRSLYERPLWDVLDLTAPLLGLRGLKLFAFGRGRSPKADEALDPENLMVGAVRSIKSTVPDMVVATEVCGCAWTSHGECVLLTEDGDTDLTASYALMSRTAVLHADAGADAVSPTAMLDGSVRAVRDARTEAGHHSVGVSPNIALHTELYGPFKRVMRTDPARGNRRGFPLEPHRARRQALAQARRREAEGADSLCPQLAMTAVDVLTSLRAATDARVIAHSTSGEYAALKALGPRGAAECLGSLKRAGADLVPTFAAEDVATHLGAARDHAG
ncbi:hypothetical protein [Streptomyces sp. S1]|uniref:hypothetical protein n=1 Tax=Streptomyces sp. S1 TaxID=718288 RepID=UPI003D7161A4